MVPQIDLNGSYKTVINNVKKMLCKVLKNPSVDPGASAIYKELTQLGNFPANCPFTIGVSSNN